MPRARKAIRTQRWLHGIGALVLFLGGCVMVYRAAFLGWAAATSTPPPDWMVRTACYIPPLFWLGAVALLAFMPRLPDPHIVMCEKCGYNREGIDKKGPCPECGTHPPRL